MDTEISKVYEPTRMCVICRERFPKKELNRYILPQSNEKLAPLGKNMLLDTKKIEQQRGIYLCNEEKCQEKFQMLKLKQKGKKA